MIRGRNMTRTCFWGVHTSNLKVKSNKKTPVWKLSGFLSVWAWSYAVFTSFHCQDSWWDWNIMAIFSFCTSPSLFSYVDNTFPWRLQSRRGLEESRWADSTALFLFRAKIVADWREIACRRGPSLTWSGVEYCWTGVLKMKGWNCEVSVWTTRVWRS